MPTNCPAGPAPQSYDPADFSPGVGGGLVWASADWGDGTTVVHLAHSRWSRHGWAWKIGWNLPPGTTQVVELHGWNLETGARVWFNLGQASADKTAVLNPRAEAGTTGWFAFPSLVYVPSAGCYVLFAQWKTGAWAIPFSAGR